MKRSFRFGPVLLVLALTGPESPDAICSSEGPSLPRPLLPAGDRDLIGTTEPYLFSPAPPPAVAADRPSEARLRELVRVLGVERRLREAMSDLAAGISRRCVGIPETEILAALEGFPSNSSLRGSPPSFGGD